MNKSNSNIKQNTKFTNLSLFVLIIFHILDHSLYFTKKNYRKKMNKKIKNIIENLVNKNL
jgi:hypothetical protein